MVITVTKFYQLLVHLVVPLTINHKTNHYIYLFVYRPSYFEIFEIVRPLQTAHTHISVGDQISLPGQVTSLEVNGTDTINQCRAFAQQLASDSVIYISEDSEKASKDLDNWLNFMDSQMTM